MNRDIDGAPTLIHYLDHLLIGVSLWHSNQSAKLSDSMIHMNHIVAHLKLLNLLQRQGNLS